MTDGPGDPTVDPEVAAWLAAHAIPTAPDPDEPGEPALRALAPALGSARVVGLATTVSGTHDLAMLAQRVLGHLVDEYGVTTLAIDAPASTATILDRHVRYGGSTALDVIDRLGDLAWRTREGAQVIDALREHNAAVPAERQVRIVGVDPGRAAYSVRVVAGVLRATVPERVEELSADLAGMVKGVPDERSPAAVERMGVHLDDDAVVEGTDPAVLAEARRHVGILRRAAAYETAGDDAPAARERLMAEAVTEAVDEARERRQDADGPVVALWGHADHLLVGDDPVPTLGHHLRAALGDGYYALGLLAGSGDCRVARRRRFSGASRALQRQRLPAAADLAAELTAATRGDHLVDLRDRAAEAPAAVTRWCGEEHATRVVAEEVVGRTPPPLRPVVPGRAADGWATVAAVRAANA